MVDDHQVVRRGVASLIRDARPEWEVLYLICLSPFSLHTEDVYSFCEENNFNYVEITNNLIGSELIYMTKPRKYINVLIEMKLLRMESYKLFAGYFAHDEQILERATTRLLYANCEFARPLLQQLIYESLKQRFHRAEGYFINPAIGRGVPDLISDNDKERIKGFLYNRYKNLAMAKDNFSILSAYLALDRYLSENETDFSIYTIVIGFLPW